MTVECEGVLPSAAISYPRSTTCVADGGEHGFLFLFGQRMECLRLTNKDVHRSSFDCCGMLT